MATPVTLTRYRANDGTLHETSAAADRHDQIEAEKAYVAGVYAAVADGIKSAISDEIYNEWQRLESWQQEGIVEAVVKSLIKDREALVEALVNPA